MFLSDFDFVLPDELIAQTPPAERGASRLLALDRTTGSFSDHRFRDLPALLEPGDLLVVNDTKVFAARLLGRRLPGGGQAECLLVRRLEAGADGERWEALVHPGQRLKEGSRLEFGDDADRLLGEICARRFHGRRLVRLWSERGSVSELVDRIGHVPLPPYIKRPDNAADRDRYQTIYAKNRGSIAAPTAGLHFTPDVLAALETRGVELVAVTLHVGYGTFQPIRSARVADHEMDAERYDVSAAAAEAITRALREGRRIIAVGTTSVRTLESLSVTADGSVDASEGATALYIVPGHRFRIVSGLLTNFHLPRSSLLVLVSAFAGRDHVLAAYNHAIQQRYRFYSYGDAMLIR